MKLLFISMTAVFLLAGCSTTDVTVPRREHVTPFSEVAFAPYLEKGTGSIQGQAFLMTRGGDVKLAAGAEISATPYTPFIAETLSMMKEGVVPSSMTTEVNLALKRYVRNAIVDAQGNFEFKELPPGDYLLEVNIQWSTGRFVTGGMVRKIVTLGPDEQLTRVMVTR